MVDWILTKLSPLKISIQHGYRLNPASGKKLIETEAKLILSLTASYLGYPMLSTICMQC